MTKQEFYDKYNKILTQNSVDTLSLYHNVLAIIQADNFMDEEQGNSKPLNIDDFAYTLNSDMQLKNIFRTSTLKVNMQVGKAKEMYEVQLYRLLLDALMLTMEKDVPKECNLLSPSALKVSEILKLGIYRCFTEYADEKDCSKVLDLLSETDNLNNTTEDLFEFCQIMLEAYRFINDETLFNIQPDLTNLVLGKKYKNYGFNVSVTEGSIIDESTYIRNVKDNFVQLLLAAFNDDLLVNLFKICRTPKNLSVNLYGANLNVSLEMKPILNQYIKTIGDLNNIVDFDKQQYFNLLKIWFSINK